MEGNAFKNYSPELFIFPELLMKNHEFYKVVYLDKKVAN